jgi:cytidylate kinase
MIAIAAAGSRPAKRAQTFPADAIEGEVTMPLIAMTREMGSLGKDVATALAERLKKKVAYHEIIDHLADKMRVRKSHVIRLLEGKAGIWERLTADKTSLCIYTADETFSLAEHEETGVIRGWGAAHLLRPVPHVISVRVCAPFELRVKHMMERIGTDDRAFVEKEVRNADEAIGAITRRHFDIDWRIPEQYDLALNTERLTIRECVEEVMALFDAPEFQETPESLGIFRDLALSAHVRAALRHDLRTRKMLISVTAKDGVVTLEGVVDPSIRAEDAAEVAGKVPRVADVVSKLQLMGPTRQVYLDA